jgi:hypothetical protein
MTQPGGVPLPSGHARHAYRVPFETSRGGTCNGALQVNRPWGSRCDPRRRWVGGVLIRRPRCAGACMLPFPPSGGRQRTLRAPGLRQVYAKSTPGLHQIYTRSTRAAQSHGPRPTALAGAGPGRNAIGNATDLGGPVRRHGPVRHGYRAVGATGRSFMGPERASGAFAYWGPSLAAAERHGREGPITPKRRQHRPGARPEHARSTPRPGGPQIAHRHARPDRTVLDHHQAAPGGPAG